MKTGNDDLKVEVEDLGDVKKKLTMSRYHPSLLLPR